jgi:uncharacterized protein YjbJ (UPF0337 family)
MNRDEIKGKGKDIAGRIQRQAGEWTGDEEAQAEGAAKQAEGKVQKAWGKIRKEGEELAEDLKKKDRERKPGNTSKDTEAA